MNTPRLTDVVVGRCAAEATEVYARLDGSCDSDYHTTVNRA